MSSNGIPEESHDISEILHTVIDMSMDDLEEGTELEEQPVSAATLVKQWKLGQKYPSAKQMEKIDLQPKEYWCNPVIPKSSKIQITGLPKSGKGHLVEKAGLCLSEGEDFLGFHCEPCRVLYMEFESTDTDLKERVELKKAKLKVRASKFHYRLHSRPLCLDLEKSESGLDGVDKLAEILAEFRDAQMPINVVILDPRIKLMKDDPERVFLSWTSNANKVIRDFNISLVVVHHEGKYNYGDVAKKGLDSIKYNAWFDVLMSLQAGKDKDGVITSGVLEYAGKIPDSGRLNLSFEPGYCLWDLSKEEHEAKQSKKDKAKSTILRMVGSEESEIKAKALADGIGHTTFHNAIRELIDEGKVKSIPIDKNKRRIELSPSHTGSVNL